MDKNEATVKEMTPRSQAIKRGLEPAPIYGFNTREFLALEIFKATLKNPNAQAIIKNSFTMADEFILASIETQRTPNP